MVDWGDYVVVDAVNGQEMTVHTTRDPRWDDTTPYQVLVAPDTIITSTSGVDEAVGVYEGVRPGDTFYFVGGTVTEYPSRRVEAVRIFPGL